MCGNFVCRNYDNLQNSMENFILSIISDFDESARENYYYTYSLSRPFYDDGEFVKNFPRARIRGRHVKANYLPLNWIIFPRYEHTINIITRKSHTQLLNYLHPKLTIAPMTNNGASSI